MRLSLACAVVLGTTACGSDEPVAAAGSTDFFESPRGAVDLDPSPEVLHVELRAEPFVHHVAGQSIEGYAYNGQTPGPTLRAKVGDRLIVDFENALAEDTTIHWHGVHVPYAMDGVTWQSRPVAPGARFRYEFTLDHAGTFWYHPHFDSTGQVDRGLYGVLVVEEPSEPKLDDDLILVFDVWDEPAAGTHGMHRAPASDSGTRSPFGTRSDGTGAEYPQWTVNGLAKPHWKTRGGRAVRTRLLNASTTSYLDLRWPEIRQIATDQGLLPRLLTPERIVLAPGDRAEVEWLIGESGFTLSGAPYSLFGSSIGSVASLLDVVVTESHPAPAEPVWPFTQDTAATPDPGSTDIVYTFSGDLRTNDWRINGEKFPDVTITSLPLGTSAILEVRNASPTEHPFHLHGHAFEVLSVNGTVPDTRLIEDTWNLAVRDLARLRLVADNPGEWMAHCHILQHADSGMMTVLRVGTPE